MVLNLTQILPPVKTARPEIERIEDLISKLKQKSGVDPAEIKVVKAPLRICPLGAHIDHQLGNVTGMTIDQALLMAFAPTRDGTVHIESLDFAPAVSFGMHHVPSYRPRDWANYIRGAVLALKRNYHLTYGLTGVVVGEMPVGGLSSSAAVTITYLLALEAVNAIDLSPKDNVNLVRFTENNYIGLKNGILDQSVILFSQKNHLTHIDCQTVRIDQVSGSERRPPFEILVVYSGVARSLVGTAYNNRVAECQSATRQLLEFAGQEASDDPRLRHVPSEVFETKGHRLPSNLYRRAKHYFGEMQRVEDGVQAWVRGDIRQLGQLISASCESSIKYYESGSPQLITLHEILRDTPGVYGGRFSGAGFRGCYVALIDPVARDSIAETIHQSYPLAHPSEAEVYSIHFCQPDGNARVLTPPWEF